MEHKSFPPKVLAEKLRKLESRGLVRGRRVTAAGRAMLEE